MNVYASARMADSLAVAGYVTSDSPDGADIVILNTCHIREKAAEKKRDEVRARDPLSQKSMQPL